MSVDLIGQYQEVDEKCAPKDECNLAFKGGDNGLKSATPSVIRRGLCMVRDESKDNQSFSSLILLHLFKRCEVKEKSACFKGSETGLNGPSN